MVINIVLSSHFVVFQPVLRSRSKVKIQGQGQRLGSKCHFSTGAEWSIVVLGFAKYSKKSNETQIRYTLKNHVVLILGDVQNCCLYTSNLLLFQQVGCLRSIMLLIFLAFGHYIELTSPD